MRHAEIYNNSKCLNLEITEFKTLFKCEVIDKSKYFPHIGTLRVYKYKGLTFDKALSQFREMCKKNKWI
jgi:hypothetical protein